MDLQRYTYNRGEEVVSSTLRMRTIPTDALLDSSFSRQGTVALLITKGIRMNDACRWRRSIIPDHYALQPVVREAQEDDALSFVNDPAALDYLAKHPDIQSPLSEVWPPVLGKFRTDAEISVEVFSEPDEDTVGLLMTKGIRMNDTCKWGRSIIPDHYALQPVVQESQEDDALSFINDQAVLDYLIEHPDVRRPLMEVWAAALKEFRTDAEISVEVFSEPDEDDEYLTLYVRQEEYQDDILDRIDAVRMQLRRSPTANIGRILLTTDFQPPH